MTLITCGKAQIAGCLSWNSFNAPHFFVQAPRSRQRQWLRSLGAIPLLMLLVLLWFAVEFFDLTPHSELATIRVDPTPSRGTNASDLLDAAEEELAAPPPPPPQAWDYWQKVSGQGLTMSNCGAA